MSIFRFPLLVWLGIGTLIISLGIRQSFGIFMTPISEFFGTGREFFSLTIALQNLMFGVFQPFVGMIADRFGAKRVVIAGSAVYALGLYLSTVTQQSATLYWSLGVLIGLGLSSTSYVIILGAIAKVVPAKHTTKAFGLTTAAGSFGMFAVIPGAQALLTAFNWQGALQVFAMSCALMAAFFAFAREVKLQATATAVNQTMKEALSEALHHKGYWLIHAGFFVCGFHVAFIATHLPSYLVDKSLNTQTAAMALAYVGIFNMFGSYFWGMMGDRFNKRHVMCVLYVLRTISLSTFMLLPVSEFSAVMFGASIGFCWLGTVPLTSGLVRQIFGSQYMSTLYGLVFLTHQVGSFLGAWAGGRIFDATGSYDTVWMATIVMALISALLHLPIDDRPLVRNATA